MAPSCFIATVIRNLRSPQAPSPNIPRDKDGKTPVQAAIAASKASVEKFNKEAYRTLAVARDTLKAQ